MSNKILPSASGSVCFWSWNDKLDKFEIRDQLEGFSNVRFSGVVIHSRAGLRTAYLGDEWFDFYRFAVSEAKRLNLQVWIYDEDGWPSGFAGGMVPELGDDYKAKELVFSVVTEKIPDNTIACWRKTGNLYSLIESSCATQGDLICYYDLIENYADLLSEKTVKAFIDFTHERYKVELGEYFGSVIKGVFTDEPQHMRNPWSFDLPRLWKDKFGSELFDDLYLLYIDCDFSKRFRLKYHRFINDVFFEAFTKQINRWCNDNGLLFTGHFACEDGLVVQMTTNSGVMRHYSEMGMPGIDHLGNRITSPVLCKQVASAANQFSKPDVLSETFGCAGWQISFAELAWIWGRQSALGVTKPCYHLSAYSISGRRKRDYPAFFSYQEPWWKQFAEFQKWVDGLSSLMKEGKRIVDTLVVSPLSCVAANYESAKSEMISAQYRLLMDNLMDAQLDFEIGDETLIEENGKVENGKFIVSDSSYELVIVPFAESFSSSVCNLLNKFKSQGGKIWYIGEKPIYADYQNKKYPDGLILQNRAQVITKAIMAEGISRPVTLYHRDFNRIKSNTVIHTRSIDGGKRVHIWTGDNFCNGETRILFTALGSCDNVYLVDPCGRNKELLPSVYDGNKIFVSIDIQSHDNVVLELLSCCEKKNAHKEYSFDSTALLKNVEVKQCEPNALTLDYAAFSFEGGEFSEYKPIVRNLQWLYKTVNSICKNSKTSISLKYHFFCDERVDFSSITAVIENEFVQQIIINGRELSSKSISWWIDRKFREYRIGDMLIVGENEIVLNYDIPRVKSTSYSGFESDRNRFFLPIEPESIYIKGCFDVMSGSEIVDSGQFYSIKPDHFTLSPFKDKKTGDITSQNSWFYRGNVEYKFCVEKLGPNERIYIKTTEAYGVGGVIKCGAKERIVFKLNSFVDVTDLLQVGKNEITFLLLGSNRNLMGPHHHINGMVDLVGPSTFVGTKGFEDFVSPNIINDDTWTDSYSFIRFGCQGFCVAKRERY